MKAIFLTLCYVEELLSNKIYFKNYNKVSFLKGFNQIACIFFLTQLKYSDISQIIH